jgi:hypothetical protein
VTLPGPELTTEDTAARRGARLRLSTLFVIGELLRGTDTAIPIKSLRELEKKCGARTVDTAEMHNWLETYWRLGGGAIYVTPLRGPAAAAASKVLQDGASATALTVTAKERGSWANGASGGLSVDVDVSGSNFTLTIFLNGVQVEQAVGLADGPAAAAWSTESAYVTIVDGAGGDPAATVSAQNLTGGDDDFDGITNTEIQDCVANRFPANLGVGTYVFPGRTAQSTQLAVEPYLESQNRLAKFDGPHTAVVATLEAHSTALRAGEDPGRCDVLVPRQTIPGLSGVGTRTVGGSVLRCAAEARNERDGISPNQAAAGEWGKDITGFIIAPTIEWDDDDRATLNDAGINVIRTVDDAVKVYGLRTLADPATQPAALQLGSARLRMAIVELVRYRIEKITFAEIDQGGVVLGDLVGLVRADVNAYQRSLYYLDVTASIEEGDLQGEFVLETEVEFQAAPGAERVRATITRSVTEV